MIEYIKLKDIKPAQYNPREISDTQFEKLKESIKELGFLIPILVNRQNKVIIAGHQRTKAGLAIGVESAPVFFVDNITVADEIKFNQIHNGVDVKEITYPKILKEITEYGFQQIDTNDIEIGRTQSATYTKEICKLILKYGNVLCAVACDGHIILHENYINACKALNIKANIYYLQDDKLETAKKYFAEDYGKYSYKHLKKDTYVQGLAQMHRLSEDKSKAQFKSALYETVVIPFIAKNDIKSVFDFGCGKGAYINALSKKMDATGLEFYNNNGSAINISMGNQMINKLIDRISRDGLFELVVCDSVLNSVDSVEAENAVMACLSLFSKKYIAFSGRAIDFVTNQASIKTDKSSVQYVRYYDDDKFTADYRKGKWFYQHFHNREDIVKLCERFKLKIIELKYKPSSSSWQCLCEKIEDLPTEEYIKAIDFEFNLPLPNGTYKRNEDVKKALQQIGII